MQQPSNKSDKILIFRRYYVHPKTGEKVYPKSGSVFPIWVDADDVR